MSDTFFEHLRNTDGALHSGDIRYVLVRADGLMGCFKTDAACTTLPMYTQIESSFCEFGGKSTQQYADNLGEDHQALLKKIEQTAPQLGWGKWTLSLFMSEKKLTLSVDNSPFSAGYGHVNFAVCAPISGMLKGLAQKIFMRPVTCNEHRCSAMGGKVCEFEAIVAKDIQEVNL